MNAKYCKNKSEEEKGIDEGLQETINRILKIK
jgi:hypothetical protein